jgi:hypothetical protein
MNADKNSLQYAREFYAEDMPLNDTVELRSQTVSSVFFTNLLLNLLAFIGVYRRFRIGLEVISLNRQSSCKGAHAADRFRQW